MSSQKRRLRAADGISALFRRLPVSIYFKYYIQKVAIEKGMKVWLVTGGPAMTVSRKNPADLWECHWF